MIAGSPRGVRSDEWVVNTQMIIAQAANDFKRVNYNIGGQDMSLISDVPYKEWSIMFKPQNLTFFIMPLEYAFAFKWWLLGFSLIISCYFFYARNISTKENYTYPGSIFCRAYTNGILVVSKRHNLTSGI